MKSVRICTAILFALFYLGPFMAVALPLQGMLSCLGALVRPGGYPVGTSFRRRMTYHANLHGAILLWALKWILGFQVQFYFDPKIRDVHGTVIIVAHHLSIMDIPMVAVAMQRIGRGSIRWVLKEAIRRLPLGWAATWIKCGFVKRGGAETREEDLAAVETCARFAGLDGDDVLIFPQGTRARDEKEAKVQVKRGGFDALCGVLPEADLITIAFRWSEAPGKKAGRTFLEAASDLPGRTITVVIRHVPRANVYPEWLNDHFNPRDRGAGSVRA